MEVYLLIGMHLVFQVCVWPKEKTMVYAILKPKSKEKLI